jgi:hypothetical protein
MLMADQIDKAEATTAEPDGLIVPNRWLSGTVI